jgi:hypothetical protein
MSDGPILFGAPMVRALLAGRKTQTRRIAKPETIAYLGSSSGGMDSEAEHCPYGGRGDHLWVKETWARRLDEDAIKPSELVGDWAWYWADPQTANTGCAGAAGKRRPSIFMPRRFSRITLEIESVRVERVNDISASDAKAEGLTPWSKDFESPLHWGIEHADVWEKDPRQAFRRLWDSINGERAPWSSNPWVWAIAFHRVLPSSAR